MGRFGSIKTSLTPIPFIEVSVPNQDNEWPCSCVMGVSILYLSTILIFDLGTVPTVWYYLAFILFKYVRSTLHHRWEKCSLTNTSKKKFKVTKTGIMTILHIVLFSLLYQ